MTKRCAICQQPFETLSEKRRTCSLDCAEKLRKYFKAADYSHIDRQCNFNVLNRQYHGSQFE